jgi:hypothetical protein
MTPNTNHKLDTELAYAARVAEYEWKHGEKQLELLKQAQFQWLSVIQSFPDLLLLPQELFTYAQSDFLSCYVELGSEYAIRMLPSLTAHSLNLAKKKRV